MARPTNRVLRWLLDTLLIPIAVLLILLEDVLWAGALAALRRLDDLPAVQFLRVRLERLPASIVLPLFLVPEALSHLAGFYVTVLLAQGHVGAALAMITVKLVCKLLLVWIYTTCEETLLGVPWFARFHHWTMRLLDWAKAQVGPLKARLRALLVRLRLLSATARPRLLSRLRAARIWVSRRWQSGAGE